MSLTKITITKSNIESYFPQEYLHEMRLIPYGFNKHKGHTIRTFHLFERSDIIFQSILVEFRDWDSLMNHPNLNKNRLHTISHSDGYGCVVADNALYIYTISIPDGDFAYIDGKLRELLRNGLSIYDALEFLCI